ncbi:MAG TPA: alpha/beta hydrolase [Myxococcota bacterium]|nr:alpha/beta hydrolase [Myxococcota bacterium]
MAADPRGALNPQVKVLFDMMAAGRATRVLEPKALREGLGALSALLAAGAPSVAATKMIEIPGPAGKIPARVYWPGDPKKGPYPVVVFFHGGGYVAMNLDTHDKICKQLCSGIGAVVVSVDYRLAPEARYPAPLDDCVAAYRWVAKNAAELSGDASRIAAGGDSAGGNATAAVTLKLLAAGEKLPRALLLLCPWLEMSLASESMKTFSPNDGVLDTEIMTFFRDCYVKPGDWADPFASPVRADVSKFPPTLVIAGAIDPLRDDALQFADKLKKAGREVQLSNYAGMPHDFMLFPGIDDGDRAVAEIVRYAKSKLA